MPLYYGNLEEELPIGFGLSLAMNEQAMKRFSQMDETEKSRVIEESRHVNSKREMEQLVNRIGEENVSCF
ncbi:MAG: hypothetical protein MR966_01700 [Lachnospiraceae bacterium]|nr:hypothetical protein [Lachnospiraceae bacterium]